MWKGEPPPLETTLECKHSSTRWVRTTNRSIRNCRFPTRNLIVIVLLVTTIFSGVLQDAKIKDNMQRIQDKLRSLQVSERRSDATE